MNLVGAFIVFFLEVRLSNLIVLSSIYIFYFFCKSNDFGKSKALILKYSALSSLFKKKVWLFIESVLFKLPRFLKQKPTYIPSM